MGFVPTTEQLRAISTIDRSMAVTAGAGSGKTRVLVERYLNLLNQGFTVQQIAAITFTKKAAQEMKDRLRETRPDLVEELEQAQISTFHSLCQRIIQEHPLQAGIDPRFRVGEEWETQVLLEDAVEQALRELEPPPELGSCADTAALVFDLYGQMLRKGDLNFNRGRGTEEREDELCFKELIEAVELILDVRPDTPTQAKVLDEIRADWPALQRLLGFPEDELRLEALEALLSQVKRIRGKLALKTDPCRSLLEQALTAIREAQGKRIIAYLSEVLEAVHGGYVEQKRLLGMVDYNDLEQLAHRLLSDPAVGSDYSFAHLMVDEFQDTNPLQKKIVDAFAAHGAILFVVGDPKQSIYRFRGADVDVFLQAKEEIRAQGENVYLGKNFRSRPELIEFANWFFEQVMQGEAIPFEPSEPHKDRVGRSCLTVLQTEAPGLLSNEARALEAEQIALKIRQLVADGAYRYEQISLLFRTMTNVHIYEKALKTAGIPFVNLSGRGFYSKQEIQDVLHYFRWLEDPADQVARLAVLRSPFYLISDQGLFWICQNRLDELSEGERQALQRSEQDYSFLGDLVKRAPAPQALTALFERTHYLQNTWRLPFGPQKVANVEKLLEQSWDLFARDLFSFPEQVRFLRLMVRKAPTEGEALLDAEHADVVILRTIHGAKGLEFPVVFLPDTNGRLLKSRTEKVLYHPDQGLAYRGTGLFEQINKQDEFEALSEAKRLLYVALTRAEEQFYWCSREGATDKHSWWKWLQDLLEEAPPGLYSCEPARQLAPDLPVDGGSATQLEIPQYQPLPPQYNQVLFSVTSLMNYVRCPRYYYLRYILGVPERGGEAAPKGRGTAAQLTAIQRGNIVHRVCEQISAAGELTDLLDYAASMEDVELTMAQKRQLKTIIDAYLHSEFFHRVRGRTGQNWTVHREHDFLVPAGTFLINGLVDQVFVGATATEIVDFKSNWVTPEQVNLVGESYAVQLRIYAWAMAREFAAPISRAQAYFLIPNRLYALPEALLDPDSTEAWLIETCAGIIKNNSVGAEAFPATADCRSCPHNSYCGKSVSFGENTDVIRGALEE